MCFCSYIHLLFSFIEVNVSFIVTWRTEINHNITLGKTHTPISPRKTLRFPSPLLELRAFIVRCGTSTKSLNTQHTHTLTLPPACPSDKKNKIKERRKADVHCFRRPFQPVVNISTPSLWELPSSAWCKASAEIKPLSGIFFHHWQPRRERGDVLSVWWTSTSRAVCWKF